MMEVPVLEGQIGTVVLKLSPNVVTQGRLKKMESRGKARFKISFQTKLSS